MTEGIVFTSRTFLGYVDGVSEVFASSNVADVVATVVHSFDFHIFRSCRRTSEAS